MEKIGILIKQYVTMPEIISFYGIEMKKGMINCPFHSEKTGSAKIYKDHFYCFGCGENGNVIDFVMKYEGLSFKDACRAIDSYFSLGLYAEKLPENQRRLILKKQTERSEKLEKEKNLENEKDTALKNYAACDLYIENHKPDKFTENLEKTFVKALKYKEYWWSIYENCCTELYLMRKDA